KNMYKNKPSTNAFVNNKSIQEVQEIDTGLNNNNEAVDDDDELVLEEISEIKRVKTFSLSKNNYEIWIKSLKKIGLNYVHYDHRSK
ncbi:9389_t:CDS:2, partial [Cetraspora pellucida]